MISTINIQNVQMRTLCWLNLVSEGGAITVEVMYAIACTSQTSTKLLYLVCFEYHIHVITLLCYLAYTLDNWLRYLEEKSVFCSGKKSYSSVEELSRPTSLLTMASVDGVQ